MTGPGTLSQLVKHAKPLVSVTKHSAPGLMPISSSLSEPQVTKDFTMSSSSSATVLDPRIPIPKSKRNASSTAESHQKAKKEISKGKSNSCSQSSQITSLSQTLGQDSTGKDLAYGNFFSTFSEAMSKKLWLPTETGSVGLPLNFCPGSFRSIRSNSWFSMKQFQVTMPRWPQMFYPFSRSMLVESMEKDPIKTEKHKNKESKTQNSKVITRALKIRIYPHSDDKPVIHSWFGSARYTYNMALDAVENLGMAINFISLRNRWVTKRNLLKDFKFKDKGWLFDTPKHIREGAIRDLVHAYETNFAKKKTNPKHHFKIKHRIKKDLENSIVLDRQNLSFSADGTQLRICPKSLKHPIRMELKDPAFKQLPKKIEVTCRLSMTRSGRYFIHVPVKRTVQDPENQGIQNAEPRICAVDPGVSPFMGVYSPTPAIAYQIGVQDKFQLEKIVAKLDRVLWKAKRIPVKTLRKKLMKAYYRGRERLEQKIRHMHLLTARFLVNHFDIILYPEFHVKSMVRRGPKRKIRQRTVKNLYNWNFYKFKQILTQKAEEMGKTLKIVSERDTSRTCGMCFVINPNLGGLKTFKCVNPKCQVTYDRDVAGGARNIFLKNFGLI